VFKLRQKDPSADSGTLSLFYKGDAAHAGFDNVTFISRDQISFVEDAGATPAWAAQRPRLGLPAERQDELREPGQPADSLARPGP
jgi:hypothetical protein